ncbi:unnamed protein product [Dicrocoelium dendriticum]|nr:unnamed protein product [Dicrocoelium dendriticum]
MDTVALANSSDCPISTAYRNDRLSSTSASSLTSAVDVRCPLVSPSHSSCGAPSLPMTITTEPAKYKRVSRWYFGGLASGLAAGITHPLDLIKVCMQTPGAANPTFIRVAIRVVQSDGLLGLYNGLSASLLRQATYSLPRFGLYEMYKNKAGADLTIAFYEQLIVAGCAGFVGGLCGQPADLINVRMQNDMKKPTTERRNYKHCFDGLLRVYRQGGVTELYSGVSMMASRSALMTVGQAVGYDQCKHFFLWTGIFQDTPSTHLLSGVGAAASAVVLTQPFDVLKTRMQNATPALWATRLTEDVHGNRDLYTRTTLRELILYILFLVVLMIIAFIPINENTYVLTKMMERTFLETVVSEADDTTLSSVNSLDDLWKVIRGPFMSAVYARHWYNGQLAWTDADHMSVQYDNHLVGLIRLRQLRMSGSSCVVPSDFQTEIKECIAAYNVQEEDKAPFGLEVGSAWTYTDPSILQMETFLGDVAAYGGGGYYEDLSNNRTEADEQLVQLFENLWLDRGTRAVFLHFTTYNANLNIFCVAEILIEFPATGGAQVSPRFRSIKLLRYVTTLDYFVLACECIFTMFTFYYIVEEAIEISKQKWAYFWSVWNILDIVIIVLSLTCVAFNIYRTIRVNDILDQLLIEKNKFANFQWLSIWQMNFNYGIAITVFLSWVKLFKYISFNKTMTQLSSTLGNCAKDLGGFAVMFCIIFFAFAELGYLAFGTQVHDFRKFTTAVYTLFRIILGDFDFGALERANSTFGPIYFIVYVFFVFFILINMFIAIINETYTGVKSDLQNQQNEFEVKDFFKNRMKNMLKRMKRKKSRIERLQKAMELAHSSGERRMSFDELRQHLSASGFSTEEIDTVFGRFDSDHDHALSSTEQVTMKIKLEEEKMALVSEIAKEEKLNLDTPDGEDHWPQKPEVKQCDYVNLLNRVSLIESSIVSVVKHLDNALKEMRKVEAAKLVRMDTMTKLIRTVSGTEPEERAEKLQEILNDGLQQYEESSEEKSDSLAPKN